MGGATITHNGTKEEILEHMKGQVKAAHESGLYPDSSLVIIDIENQNAELFKVDVSETGEAIFTEINEGPIFHVGIAARFNPPPEPGQLVGTLHFHS